ncbi:MAG TPA: cysteine synthase family protein [Mycobacteriales bacterium]|nr:cysteine synthase family protein [Mycobacteriales bacterium]
MRYESIVDTVGDTPLVRLHRILPEGAGTVWLKLEGFNPGGSVKDRPARQMVRAARAAGVLAAGGTVVEASSGNLGAALAMVGAAEGHPVRIMIDPRTSTSNAAAIAVFGAGCETVTEPDENGKYQLPRIRRARAVAAGIPGAFVPDQWGNPDNPAAHELATGPEIVRELAGAVAAVVCTTSSCGQVTGVGRAVKRAVPGVRVVAVDGVGSMALGGPRGHHKLTGIGSGFTPDNLDPSVIDEVYWCADGDAFATCRVLAREEGVLVGGSSGAATFLALKLAVELGAGQNVVAVCPDGGERYLDTVYDDGWLAANGCAGALSAGPADLVRRTGRYQPVPGARITPYRVSR